MPKTTPSRISASVGADLIQILRDVSRTEILPHFRNLDRKDVETKTSATDLVTIADKNAEAAVRQHILARLPDCFVVGEEAVEIQPTLLSELAKKPLVAIIDPIDGTWNFANGLPLFGVILSIVEHGKTTFGVLYDPITDTWVYAHEGKGAYLAAKQGSQQKLSLSTKNNAAGLTGTLPLFLFPAAVRPGLVSAMNAYNPTSWWRCSCHEYRVMAEGGLDFCLTSASKPWDHAAGEMIFREAGGYAAMLADGSPYDPTKIGKNLLLAPNKAAWSELRSRFLPVLEEQ